MARNIILARPVLCLATAVLISGWPAAGFADPSDPSPYVPQSKSSSSFDSQLSGINGSVSSLLSEKYVPPGGVKPVAAAQLNQVQLQNNDETPTIVGAEQTAAIKGATTKLYNQGFPAQAPQNPPIVTDNVAPQIVNVSTAAVDVGPSVASIANSPVDAPSVSAAPAAMAQENPTPAPAARPIENAKTASSAPDLVAIPVATPELKTHAAPVVASAPANTTVASKEEGSVNAASVPLAAAASTPSTTPVIAAIAPVAETKPAPKAIDSSAPFAQAGTTIVADTSTSAAAASAVLAPTLQPDPSTSNATATSTATKANAKVASAADAKKAESAKADVAKLDPSQSAKTSPVDKLGIGLSAHAGGKPGLDKDMENAPRSVSLENEEGSAEEDIAFLRKIAGTDKLLLSDNSGGAQGAPIAEPIALEDSVIYALKNNYEVKAGEEGLRSAWWDKLGAYSEYLPSVSYAYSQGAEKSDPASINDDLGNRVLNSTHFRRDRGLNVQQPIIDLSVLSDIFSAEDKEDLAKINHKDQREGIASDTINAYMKLMQERIAMALAEQYKGYLDNLLNRMTERVKGGAGTAADLDRIKSRATVAESARIEAEGQFETDLAEYSRLTKVIPSQIVIPSVLAAPVPTDSSTALAAAIRNNPSYQAALSKIDLAKDDRNKGYAGLMPRLSVQYAKQFSYDAGGAAEGNPVDGVYPDQTTESIMLVAQWSLNGGTAIASGLSATAKESQMDYQAQDSRARLEQAVRSSYTAINAAKERRRVLKKNVDENERVASGFEEQYTAGTRSLFDLLDAYEQLYSSRVNLMRVVIASAQARYAVHRQMGQLISSIVDGEKK